MCVEDIIIGRNMYWRKNDVTDAAPITIKANPLRYAIHVWMFTSGGAVALSQGSVPWVYVYGPMLGSSTMGEVHRLFKASDYGQLVTGEITAQCTVVGQGWVFELMFPDDIGNMIQQAAKKVPKPTY